MNGQRGGKKRLLLDVSNLLGKQRRNCHPKMGKKWLKTKKIEDKSSKSKVLALKMRSKPNKFRSKPENGSKFGDQMIHQIDGLTLAQFL